MFVGLYVRVRIYVQDREVSFRKIALSSPTFLLVSRCCTAQAGHTYMHACMHSCMDRDARGEGGRLLVFVCMGGSGYNKSRLGFLWHTGQTSVFLNGLAGRAAGIVRTYIVVLRVAACNCICTYVLRILRRTFKLSPLNTYAPHSLQTIGDAGRVQLIGLVSKGINLVCCKGTEATRTR